MPALRERGEDIPQIVDFCLQNLVKQRKARVGKVSPEAMAVLVRHTWPGNVRELENVVYRSAVIAQGDAILVKDLPAELGGGASSAPADATPGVAFAEAAAAVRSAPDLPAAFDAVYAAARSAEGGALAFVERELVARALAANGGDAAAAAKELGLTKAALQKRMKAG
jgi:two-component system nitrogen regulation response regulator GlnG